MLIGLRNAMMAGDEGLSAKSYAQNGLVAMWDGIENAGWGRHDATAEEWVDLSGNGFNLSPTPFDFVTWSENSARVKATTGMCAYGDFRFTDRNLTIEFISNIPIAGNNRGVIAINRTGGWNQMLFGFRIAASSIYLGYNGNQTNVGIHDKPISLTLSCEDVSQTSIAVSCYLKGVSTRQLTAVTSSTHTAGNKIELFKTSHYDWGGGLSGDLFRAAVYSRALTAEEIAYHYAVDKARFNLP